MSNTTYVTDMLNRLVAIQKEVPTTPLANNAVPQAFYTQEDMPFWTNRIVGYRSKLYSQDYTLWTYRVGMTYVRAFLTEGVTGQAELDLYTDIPIISEWFRQTIRLSSGAQGGAYFAPMLDIDPVGAYITDMTVLLGQMHSGIGAKVIGADFIIEVPLLIPVQQRY